MRRAEHAEQKGYFTFAQNSNVNYLEIAYLQALSIKATQTINSYAIAVDEETKKLITDDHRKVFDYIIDIPNDEAKDQSWKLENEWMAWWLTPFKETIKLDSDIIFTRNIDHWWHICQQKEVCCATSVRDYEGKVTTDSTYRQLHIKNNLPNIYSGFAYFRYSQHSMNFYSAVRDVYHNWPLFRDKLLKDCRHPKANTDEAYAIAALIVGEDECYLPGDIPSFVHMKGAIQGWTDIDWVDRLYAQIDDNANLTVGFNRQQYPFHYVTKTFATGELIDKYKRILASS